METRLEHKGESKLFLTPQKKPVISTADVKLLSAVDTYVSVGSSKRTLSLGQAKREEFFKAYPLIKSLLTLSQLNPLLEEGECGWMGRSHEGEYFLPKDALCLLIYFKLLKHKSYNTKNVFVVDNDIPQLISNLNSLELKAHDDAKFIFIDAIHVIPFYLRREEGKIKCFIVDPENFDSNEILDALITVFGIGNLKIIISKTQLQNDYFSCSIFGVKALQYFMKHGPDLFKELESKKLVRINQIDWLDSVDLMPKLLKLCQTWSKIEDAISDEAKKTIVSTKDELTLDEYHQKNSQVFSGKKFNTKAIVLNYKYFAFLDNRLQEILNDAEAKELIQGVIPQKLMDIIKIVSPDTQISELVSHLGASSLGLFSSATNSDQDEPKLFDRTPGLI